MLETALSQEVEALHRLTNDISVLQRGPPEEYVRIFQAYDSLLSSPSVHVIADALIAHREAIQQLEDEEAAVNVTDPEYYKQREARQRHKAEAAASPDAALVQQLYEVDALLQHMWGIVVTVSEKLHPEEKEHVQEIITDYEELVQHGSSYLRAIALTPSCSVEDTVSLYQLHYGNVEPVVIVAGMHKHAPSTTAELKALRMFLEAQQVPITVTITELFEKSFVRCMRAEGAEFAFHCMIRECGLPPLTTRPFAMVFNVQQLKQEMDLVDYYEMMLDFGIRAEPSTLRILCNRCKQEIPLRHFTLLSRCEESQAPRKDDDPEFQRKFSSSFYSRRLTHHASILSSRLNENGQGIPVMPLMEALKTIHRMAVEKFDLGDVRRVALVLLVRFCHGITPLENLQLPFYLSKAYGTERLSLPAAPATKVLSSGKGERPENAFDFGLRSDDEGELLESEGEGSGEDFMSDSPDGIDEELEPRQQQGTRRTLSHHTDPNALSEFSTLREEVFYVLAACKETFGWTMDHGFQIMVWKKLMKERDLWIFRTLELLVYEQFRLAREEKGACGPIVCALCVELIDSLQTHEVVRANELVKEVLVQIYDFEVVYKLPWADPNPDTPRYELDNQRCLRSLLISLGNHRRHLDWCGGLVALNLIFIKEEMLTSLAKRFERSFNYQMKMLGAGNKSPHYHIGHRILHMKRNEILNTPSFFYGRADEKKATAHGHPTESRTLVDYLNFLLRWVEVPKHVREWYLERLMSLAPPPE